MLSESLLRPTKKRGKLTSPYMHDWNIINKEKEALSKGLQGNV